MKIISADFVISNSEVKRCPKEHFPEYAFIGRSNVGKSSLINALMNRKSLAKTSGKPGKTQLINHFLINKNWFLVDLPGYGYAKVSKSEKRTFQRFITNYFKQREQLVSAFVLVDSRHAPQKIDLAFMEWLATNGVPFFIIFTKSDKLTKTQLPKNIEAYKNKMLEFWEEMPPYFVTSSSNKNGSDEVLKYIEKLNEDFYKNKKAPN